MDFQKLEKQGEDVIYKELETNERPKDGWDYWGEKVTSDEHLYVYRKIVTIEKARRYNHRKEEELLN